MAEKLTQFAIKTEGRNILEQNEAPLIYFEELLPALEIKLKELYGEIVKLQDENPEIVQHEDFKQKQAIAAGIKAHLDQVKQKIAGIKASNIIAQVQIEVSDKCNFSKLVLANGKK